MRCRFFVRSLHRISSSISLREDQERVERGKEEEADQAESEVDSEEEEEG